MSKIKGYREKIIQDYGIEKIKDKVILEVGGDHTLEVANYLVEHGAYQVISISIDKRFPVGAISEKLHTHRISIHNIQNFFSAEKFDLVIGIAILEHIPMLDNMMEELYAVTKPGGSVILHGGPIWTSPKGHHVWANIDGQQYSFTNESNPIPNWHHLLNNYDSMVNFLKEEKNIIPKHAEAISNWIYNSQAINRYSYDDIVSTLKSSKFNLVKLLEAEHTSPEGRLRDELINLQILKENKYSIGGITAIFDK